MTEHDNELNEKLAGCGHARPDDVRPASSSEKLGDHAGDFKLLARLSWEWVLVVAAAVVAVALCTALGFAHFTHAHQSSIVSSKESASSLIAQTALAEEAQIEALETRTFEFAHDVEVVLQYPSYAAGCEMCSLTSAIGAIGYDVSAGDLIDKYLTYSDSGDFSEGFVGSPYTSGVAFPPVIIACANAYLADQGSAYTFTDYSGESFDTLVSMVERGIPVLVWTTTDFQWGSTQNWTPWGYSNNGWWAPSYAWGAELGEGEHAEYSWYTNEHCVLLCGADDDEVTVMDPQQGFVTVSRDLFETSYENCGKFACGVAVL